MTQASWARKVTRMVGNNIKTARREVGKMSAQKLADLCAEMGHPIQRDVISNLENGRRASLPITDLIVIAEALGVPALSLIFDPKAAGDEIERVPGRQCYLWEASDDFAGNRPEGFSGRTYHEEAFATWKRTEVLRSLAKWEAAAFEYASDADALQEAWDEQTLLEKRGPRQESEPSPDLFGDQFQSDADYQEQINILEVALNRALRAICQHRLELEKLQVKVWPLTDILLTRYAAIEAEVIEGVKP